MPTVKRALISVYDKTGVSNFARELKSLGVEIISTGGTAKHLQDSGIATTLISDLTKFPEILGGRVKTLHPVIYGGLLSLRDNAEQMAEVQAHGIGLIDMVVVNLYPFELVTADPDVSLGDALENIDIGGPCMIRAAAKNHPHVGVITSPTQYDGIIVEMKQHNGELSADTCRRLAGEAFARTSDYDAAIHAFLARTQQPAGMPQQIQWQLNKVQELRYGENPHQKAALYKESRAQPAGLIAAKQLHGKALSFNNLIDVGAALGMVQAFSEPCVAIVKHTNPCGVATAASLAEAYQKAKATDPVSSFGSVVGVNRSVDAAVARAISEVFTEVVIAPSFEADALEILQAKKNLRLLALPEFESRAAGFDVKQVPGGLLLQDQDFFDLNDIEFRVVSKRQPTDQEWQAMKFGWRVCKWVKSNAIVYALADRTIGVGAGQMSRVDSSQLAAEKAQRMDLSLKGTALASDAFFPFRDGVDVAAAHGATAIIQPGGSVRDHEIVQAIDEHDMAMVFTGVRHFRH